MSNSHFKRPPMDVDWRKESSWIHKVWIWQPWRDYLTKVSHIRVLGFFASCREKKGSFISRDSYLSVLFCKSAGRRCWSPRTWPCRCGSPWTSPATSTSTMFSSGMPSNRELSHYINPLLGWNAFIEMVWCVQHNVEVVNKPTNMNTIQ